MTLYIEKGTGYKMQIFSFEYFIKSFPKLLPYLPLTIGILLLSVIFSLLLGLFLTWCKLRKKGIIKIVAEFYTQIIRGTPFLVLLFILYFGFPKLMLNLFHLDISGWTKVFYIVVTLSMFGSARMSEAMRSAYLAVPKGQMEAAYSCGLSAKEGFIYIVLPQALYLALPNLTNLIISNLLETSVGFSIGIIDFVGNARLINTRSYGVGTLEVYVAVAVTYWILSIVITKLLEEFESFLGRHQGIRCFQKN